MACFSSINGSVLSSLYFPTRMTVVDNQFGDYSIYSSKDLMKVIRDEQQNPYIGLFSQHVLPSLLTDRPDLVGCRLQPRRKLFRVSRSVG